MSDLPILRALRARVEAAQALAAKATPGPWAMQGAQSDYTIMHPTGSQDGWATGPVVLEIDIRHDHHVSESDADLMAAAPDLVTLATDLWAAYMAARDRADGRDHLEAMERADAAARKDIGVRLGMQSPEDTASCLADFEDAIVEARQERDEARAELDAIRATLGNGADEAAWPPGLTVAEAVGRLRDLVDIASGFEISEPTVAVRSLGGVRVERCGQLEGPDLWAVRQRGNVLGRDGYWTYEPIPSSRDEEFMAQYRFTSRDEAIKAGRAAIAGHEGPHAEALGDSGGDGGGR